MATASQALSALAGSVTKTASTITNVVGTLDASVSIVNNYVNRHLTQQETKNAIELALGKTRLEEDSALELAERRNAVNDRLKDADFAKIYAEALTEIRAITRPQPSAA
jgi:dihydroxyacetone kinase DhaKLM complex PTS-EIIA-like component DhaM